MASLSLLSGWQDSNLRPPAPKAGTLTGLRYTPNGEEGANVAVLIIWRWPCCNIWTTCVAIAQTWPAEFLTGACSLSSHQRLIIAIAVSEVCEVVACAKGALVDTHVAATLVPDLAHLGVCTP